MQGSYNWGFSNNSLNLDLIDENFNLFQKMPPEKQSLVFSNIKLLESLAELAGHNDSK